MGMNASDCLLISRSHFTEKMNGRFEELAWKCFKLYVEIVAKHIKKLGLKNQLSDVVKNSRSPYLLLMGVLYFGKNSDVAYICEQNVWADTTYFMQHLKKIQRNISWRIVSMLLSMMYTNGFHQKIK